MPGISSNFGRWIDTDVSFVVHDDEVQRRLRAEAPRVHRLLDAGCGAGTLLWNLERWFPSAELTGLDGATDLVDRLAPFVPRARLVQGDVLAMPFADAAFDVVTSTQVIEHVDDKRFVREIRRVCKPGGLCVLSSVVRGPGAFYFYRNAAGETVLEPTHLREYASLDAFTALLDEGFAVEYASLSPVRFSPIDTVVRRLRAGIDISRGWVLALRKIITVPVPRYHLCEVVARRTAP